MMLTNFITTCSVLWTFTVCNIMVEVIFLGQCAKLIIVILMLNSLG